MSDGSSESTHRASHKSSGIRRPFLIRTAKTPGCPRAPVAGQSTEGCLVRAAVKKAAETPRLASVATRVALPRADAPVGFTVDTCDSTGPCWLRKKHSVWNMATTSPQEVQ